MAKVLMKGNEVIARSAVLGGCDAFFGYPITPQNEIPEFLSRHMVDEGKVFVQAESELAAINMVYGASGAGVRAMTSSSSPGIALMQEGISYLCGAELPCVIVNVMRGGPGLGGIQPAQADYNQVTRGGGNGDYHLICYAPENLQEASEIMKMSFDVADYYRNPVMVAMDGLIGQMMESVDLDVKVEKRELREKTWAATGGHTGSSRRIITSLYLDPKQLENHNYHLDRKFKQMIKDEQRFELINMEDAEIIIVAYGTMARICRSSIEELKNEGINVGMIRPITLWPFPDIAFDGLSAKGLLVCELSLGQMVGDVKLAANGKLPVSFFGRVGGMLPDPSDISEAVKKFLSEVNND
jgi:2-oxoglutarate ferredoxin oxidoreductase subunit alpha